MTFESASRVFDIAIVVLNAAGICMIAHFAFSVALRARIRASEPLFGEVFGSPAWGDLTRHPWLMRARFFWPWVSSPALATLHGRPIRILFWEARLAGAGAILGFVGFLATMVYIGVRSA
jgi:hypothetical protein